MKIKHSAFIFMNPKVLKRACLRSLSQPSSLSSFKYFLRILTYLLGEKTTNITLNSSAQKIRHANTQNPKNSVKSPSVSVSPARTFIRYYSLT